MVTRELAQKIIDEYAETGVLSKALKKYNVTRTQYRKALEHDFQLQSSHALARETAADMQAEEILEIADTDTDPFRARNRIDARKWLASKTAPKIYGDRIDINVTQRPDLRAAIEEGEQRRASVVLPMRDLAQVSDAQIIEIPSISASESNGSQPALDAKPSEIDPCGLLD